MKLYLRPSDPVVVDRWLDVAFILLWVSYGGWGLVTALVGLPTVTQLTPGEYQTVWSGVLGLIAMFCATMATLVFFDTKRPSLLSKKKNEFWGVIVLCAFITVYPGLLVVRLFEGDGHLVGGATVLGFSYLIFPILRLHLLRGRIKNLESLVKPGQTGPSKVVRNAP